MHFNGSAASASATEADNAVFNGTIKNISVNGANHVVINGTSQNICVLAKNISGLNGVIQPGGRVVLAGEEQNERARLDAINASSDSKILIMNFDVNVINGSFSELIIDGGHVEHINGRVDEIKLVNGATVGHQNVQP